MKLLWPKAITSLVGKTFPHVPEYGPHPLEIFWKAGAHMEQIGTDHAVRKLPEWSAHTRQVLSREDLVFRIRHLPNTAKFAATLFKWDGAIEWPDAIGEMVDEEVSGRAAWALTLMWHAGATIEKLTIGEGETHTWHRIAPAVKNDRRMLGTNENKNALYRMAALPHVELEESDKTIVDGVPQVSTKEAPSEVIDLSPADTNESKWPTPFASLLNLEYRGQAALALWTFARAGACIQYRNFGEQKWSNKPRHSDMFSTVADYRMVTLPDIEDWVREVRNTAGEIHWPHPLASIKDMIFPHNGNRKLLEILWQAGADLGWRMYGDDEWKLCVPADLPTDRLSLSSMYQYTILNMPMGLSPSVEGTLLPPKLEWPTLFTDLLNEPFGTGEHHRFASFLHAGAKFDYEEFADEWEPAGNGGKFHPLYAYRMTKLPDIETWVRWANTNELFLPESMYVDLFDDFAGALGSMEPKLIRLLLALGCDLQWRALADDHKTLTSEAFEELLTSSTAYEGFVNTLPLGAAFVTEQQYRDTHKAPTTTFVKEALEAAHGETIPVTPWELHQQAVAAAYNALPEDKRTEITQSFVEAFNGDLGAPTTEVPPIVLHWGAVKTALHSVFGGFIHLNDNVVTQLHIALGEAMHASGHTVVCKR